MMEYQKMDGDGNVYKDVKNVNYSMLPGDLQRSPDESFSKKDRKLNGTLVFVDEGLGEPLFEYNHHFLTTLNDKTGGTGEKTG